MQSRTYIDPHPPNLAIAGHDKTDESGPQRQELPQPQIPTPIMNSKNTPEPGTNDGGAVWPHETLNQNLGEAALTTPPVNCNSAGERGLIVRGEISTFRPSVEPNGHLRAVSATGGDTPNPRVKIAHRIEQGNTTRLEYPQPKPEPSTNTGTETSATKTTPAANENPNDVVENSADENNLEEITAEEIMAKHAEEAPSDDNGFSLDEVVATEQVVPANLARAAGGNFRKPNDKEFIRVTRNPKEIMPFDILEVDDKTNYIITPKAMAEIHKLHEEKGQVMIKTKRKLVYLTTNLDGVGFLWPITVLDADNTWLESAHNCASVAKDQWIRVVSNNPAKRYDYHQAKKNAGVVPKWPRETFSEMLNLAFKNKVIKSLDHPAIKQLLDVD
jgi:hypothetical protein